MSDQDAPALQPGIPEYVVEYQQELELWVVLESGFPLCYCPEKGSALFIAQACRVKRLATSRLSMN